MEMLTNSIILPGPIENLQGIRARQTPEEEKVFAHPDRSFSNGLS
jgi:hypothetical protein